MKVEALNCPNCGAGVASDRTLCEFCKTRLMTVICPKCFGLMFVGTRFCGHCGAMAAPVEVELNDDVGDCPRCRKPLEELRVGDAKLRGCSKCDGVWMDTNTFENVCADSERQSAVLGFFQKRTVQPQVMTKVAYVPCPDCGQLMNRNNFAKASGVIVDICKKHGVWFDADELPAIIEFIRRGGMDVARQRERNEIEQERYKLRQAVNDGRFGLDDVFKEADNSSIRSFVRRLFD